jgi:4-alpha-glucanotransferase
MNPNKYLLGTISKDKWKRIGTQKRAGVLAPLFSVYSRDSIGIADFRDLKLLIDWADKTDNSVVQLLPMNEMGPLNCPYDAVSSFALEPAYVCLDKIPSSGNKNIAVEINNLRKLFSGASHVDYAVKKEKERILRKFFCLNTNSEPEEFRKFKEENSYWLPDFALYKILKVHHKGFTWYDWEDKYKKRDKPALENFQKGHSREITFQMQVQWQLYKQFREVKSYVKSKKVLLKGDLPILVSRDSADVWSHPEFFKLEFASGAPPDMYCAKGQRWGMPTYNWENIANDGYRYLKEKLKYAQNFYDLLRIDHVVGLFRIWSIPYHEPLENKGLNGFFDPRDEKEWTKHGRNILSVMLESTDRLLCAEDLGVIPKTCPETLKEFGIPGNDVQRWVKDWKVKHDFLKSRDYRTLSVAMLSTHDTTNWPAWWENEAGTVDEDLFFRRCSDHRQIGFDKVKDKLFDLARSGHGRLRWLKSVDSVEKLIQGLSPKGTVPKEHLLDFIDMYNNSYHEKEKLWKHLGIVGPLREKCDAEIVKAALKISLESSSIFCINTIIDWLYLAGIFKGDPYQYRINTPGTISDKNWSLTIPISLEELLKHRVTGEIRKMIVASGRI